MANNPAITSHSPNAGPTLPVLIHRLWCWPNNDPAMGECHVTTVCWDDWWHYCGSPPPPWTCQVFKDSNFIVNIISDYTVYSLIHIKFITQGEWMVFLVKFWTNFNDILHALLYGYLHIPLEPLDPQPLTDGGGAPIFQKIIYTRAGTYMLKSGPGEHVRRLRPLWIRHCRPTAPRPTTPSTHNQSEKPPRPRKVENR